MTNHGISASSLAIEVELAVAKCHSAKLASRIHAREPTLWPGDAHRWLDWLDAPHSGDATLGDLRRLAQDARSYADVLLLGMGGSSLCPEVLAESFGQQPGFPRLRILDSSVPADVLQRSTTIDPHRTLVVVASKSGTTLETDVARRYFTVQVQVAAAADGTLPLIAITDPDSSLSKLGREAHYHHVALGEPGIGGRFSALSVFGLLPAALMGIDVARLLDSARAMARRCQTDEPDNPGVALGAMLATAARHGRNKLTLVCSARIASFGGWVEQLVAESTGKDGQGIVPIDLEDLCDPASYGDDRLFVHVRLSDDNSQDAALTAIEQAGHPVMRLDVVDVHGLGGEFFRWQFATAVAGHLMKLNPFDQPDVEAAKQAARRMMDGSPAAAGGQRLVGSVEGVEVWLPAGTGPPVQDDPLAIVRAAIADVAVGGYVAIQAYVARTDQTHRTLQQVRDLLRAQSGRATTYGFGPRFLHSTGQLHKGGPADLLCLQVTVDDPQAVEIPGMAFDFGALKRAQAAGDFEILTERGRTILRLHVGSDGAATLYPLRSLFERCLAK